MATDYAGLGNGEIEHQYIASAANANDNDVYWSVAAARKAFSNALTREWVSIGHSQGGGAVYKLSEDELVQDNSSGYLGGVSVVESLVVKTYDVSCSAGNPVRLSLYPGLDHSASMGASVPEWLSFIGGLLPSSSTVNVDSCVSETVRLFDLEHAVAPADDV